MFRETPSYNIFHSFKYNMVLGGGLLRPAAATFFSQAWIHSYQICLRFAARYQWLCFGQLSPSHGGVLKVRFNLLPVRIDHYRVMVAKGCGFSMFFLGGGLIHLMVICWICVVFVDERDWRLKGAPLRIPNHQFTTSWLIWIPVGNFRIPTSSNIIFASLPSNNCVIQMHGNKYGEFQAWKVWLYHLESLAKLFKHSKSARDDGLSRFQKRSSSHKFSKRQTIRCWSNSSVDPLQRMWNPKSIIDYHSFVLFLSFFIV